MAQKFLWREGLLAQKFLWREGLCNLLFPARCPFCRRILDAPGICADCSVNVPWTGEYDRLRTGPENFRCAGPLRYEGMVRTALLNLKFYGMADIADPLADLTAECAMEYFDGAFDLVTWVPLGRGRKRRRGYDQSERIAERVCRLWGTRLERTLVKHRENPPQSRIIGPNAKSRRRENVRGVYIPAPGARIKNRRVLLVDDICTTGETLREASRILYASGATGIVCVTAALAGDLTPRGQTNSGESPTPWGPTNSGETSTPRDKTRSEQIQ